MKLVIVNSSDIIGGAARAAFRLHRAFLENSMESSMLVQRQASSIPSVIAPKSIRNRLLVKANNAFQRSFLRLHGGAHSVEFSAPRFSMFPLMRGLQLANADIVNLHWVSGGMMIPENLKQMVCPIVWTLHDMWPFTGGCHYSEECDRYTQGCGNCPLLVKKGANDLSAQFFRRKLKYFAKANLTFVSPSQWLADCAINSGLIDADRTKIIPIGLDTRVYKPLDSTAARHAWNLPQNKKLALFGAVSPTSDERKGFNLIVDALSRMTQFNNSDLELVIFGAKSNNATDLGLPATHVGFVNDDVSLATLYSAVDVMLVPSRQEAFGLTSLEALACGVPVVAFNIGGLKDMIEHKKNGYLAKPFDTYDFANGIEWVLNDPIRRQALKENARKTAVERFSIQQSARQYELLFDRLLSNQENVPSED